MGRSRKRGFTSLGVNVIDELAKITKRMTTTEVTKFRFEKNPWKKAPFEDVEQMVIYKVMAFIKKEGFEIPEIQKAYSIPQKGELQIGFGN